MDTCILGIGLSGDVEKGRTILRTFLWRVEDVIKHVRTALNYLPLITLKRGSHHYSRCETERLPLKIPGCAAMNNCPLVVASTFVKIKGAITGRKKEENSL